MGLNRPETEGEDGKETQEVEDEKFLELASWLAVRHTSV